MKFDVLLDDGPHTLESMIQFIELYLPLLADNGVFIIEDIKDPSWFDVLRRKTPRHLHKFIRTYDLRPQRPHNKNKDDLVFVIDKSV